MFKFLFLYLVLSSPSFALERDAIELKVASWNLFNFGGGFGGQKHEIDEALRDYANIVQQYHVIFVQEIRNKEGESCKIGEEVESFNNWCSNYLDGLGYACQDIKIIEGKRPCESYGVIYKKELFKEVWTTARVKYTAEDIQPTDNLTRPPMLASLVFKNFKLLNILSLHTNPDTNPEGINYLYKNLGSIEGLKGSIVNQNENVIVLGDLNAGCEYLKGEVDGVIYPGINAYNATKEEVDRVFPSDGNYPWVSVIPDDFRTNQAPGSNCSYDKILLNIYASHFYSGDCSGVGIQQRDPFAAENQSNILNFADQTSKCVVGTIEVDDVFIPFWDRIYFYVNKKNKVKRVRLSDHSLVWVPLYFGGISPTRSDGGETTLFKNTRNYREPIHFKGKGFVKVDKVIKVYVVKYFYPNTDEKVPLGPEILSVSINAEGNIENTFVVDGLDEGEYLLIADIDGDEVYNKDIDAQQSFSVITDEDTEVPGSIGVADPIQQSKRIRVNGPEESLTIVGNGLEPDSTGALIAVDSTTGELEYLFTNVTTDKNGDFKYELKSGLPEGAYNFVFHPYEEGPIQYNPLYDVIDYDDGIGFLVKKPADYLNVASLSSYGSIDEAFKVETEDAVYVLGENGPRDQDVGIYLVSKKLAFSFLKSNETKTWETVKSKQLKLLDIAAPVDLGSSGLVAVTRTSSDGRFFEKAINELRNIDQSFIDKYGKDLNFIVDVNQNGIFDSSDLIDNHPVEKLISCLSNSASTPNCGNDKEAIKQYQNFLNVALDPSPNLAIDGSYGSSTQEASNRFICFENISEEMSDTIVTRADVGFKVLLGNEILSKVNVTDNIQVFVDFNGDSFTVDPQMNLACSTASVGQIKNFGFVDNASKQIAAFRAEGAELSGDFSLCGRQLKIYGGDIIPKSSSELNGLIFSGPLDVDKSSSDSIVLKIMPNTKITNSCYQ